MIVKTVAVAAVLAGAFGLSATAANTNELWNMNCAACHGHDGKGQTLMGRKLQIKDLTDPKVQAAITDEQITKTIKDGITKNGRHEMKGFSGKLSDDQVKALVGKVRSFKSGK